MPVLRYVVGSGTAEIAIGDEGGLALLHPADGGRAEPGRPLQFSWQEARQAAHYRLEVRSDGGQELLAAVLPAGTAGYRAPPWLLERAGGAPLRWRVLGFDLRGNRIAGGGWRSLDVVAAP